MAKKSVKFVVTAADGMAYWLAVDEHDVPLQGGAGVVDLEAGKEHVLVWWMVGSPGDAVSVAGTAGGSAVVTVKESKVPAGSNKGAGFRKFRVRA